MASQVAVSRDLLGQYRESKALERASYLKGLVSEEILQPKDIERSVIFQHDYENYTQEIKANCKYELATLAHCIATFARSPFALLAEMGRVCNRTINASTGLKNISLIPKHLLVSAFQALFCGMRAGYKTVNGLSTTLGFLAWHGGERALQWMKGSQTTVLSNSLSNRYVVYHSLGVTLLAAAALFVPIALVQMAALPILFGSLHGAINNQFTVREFPNYYTMGNYHDGTDFSGHAIKTNHLLIKPIITGCYATASITKVTGAILSAAGTAPYTPAILPVPYAAAMVAAVSLVSLVAAHLFSAMKKNSLELNLAKYAALIGMTWSDQSLASTWNELKESRDTHIAERRLELDLDPRFEQQLAQLTTAIESHILRSDLPLKWQAHHTRNWMGRMATGAGTAAVAIAAVFLRVFAL